MKVKSIKKLVLERMLLLIPFLIYGLYKNGYLIYARGFISLYEVFKPLYLCLISLVIKIIYDIISSKSIKIDENFLYVMLIALIMPYNISYIVYTIGLMILYPLSLYIEKYFTFNIVCFWYIILIIINSLVIKFSFLSPIEEALTYKFSLLDIFLGRDIGGISSTNMLFGLGIYLYLIYDFYYKKDIPLYINISYLLCSGIYFFLTNDSSYLLNSELLFGSLFVSTLSSFSPIRPSNTFLYSIAIGILAFFISLYINDIISIYVATLLISMLLNIQKKSKSSKQNKLA